MKLLAAVGGVSSLAVIAVLAFAPAEANAAKTCGAAVPTIVGTPAPELIIGTAGDDVIRAGHGADSVDGLGGNDVICGGPGNDILNGGDGNDSVRAGAGDDRVDGADGLDVIKGQGGADHASGGEDVDTCLTETHDGCEADLTVTIAGPYPVTGGDSSVVVGTATIRNQSGSTALMPYVTAQFPAAAEFVGSASDSGCQEVTVDVVTCPGGQINPGSFTVIHAAFRFPDCPDKPGEVELFSASVADDSTVDPNSENNETSLPEIVNPAPGCP